MTTEVLRDTKLREKQFLVGAAISLMILAQTVTFYMWLASLAYACILMGFVVRQTNRRLHVSLMSVGITMDLLLVLILEFQRHAVATALEFSLNPIQQTHVVVSSFATLLYFPIVVLGFISYQNASPSLKIRKWHMRFGIAAFIFRTLGFLLMFSMLSRPR